MPASPYTHRSTGRVILIVAGAVLVPIAIVLLVAGGALVAAHQHKRNSDGFYTTTGPPVTTPTHALVSDGLDFGTDGPSWLFRKSRLGTISVSATGSRSHPIFLGVARTSDVDSYLHGVAYDEVADMGFDPLSVTLERRRGATAPAAPADQRFWSTTATGEGLQTLTWPVQKGRWNVVVMNADGTAGFTTGLTVGARAGFIIWLGAGLLVAGGLLLIGAAVAIILGLTSSSRQSHSAR